MSKRKSFYNELREALAQARVNVDMMMQHASDRLQFVVHQDDVGLTKQQLQPLLSEQAGVAQAQTTSCAKVSVVGMGMQQHAGIASQALVLLAEQGISVELVRSSACKVSFVLPVEHANRAAELLHQRFITD